MNYEDHKFTVNSTWIAKEDSLSLEEVVSIENVNDSEWMHLTEGEIGHLVQLEDDDHFKPLQLIRQNKNESCTLSLDVVDSSIKVTKLTVISEARIIEFYGKHGEYICTEKGHQVGRIAGKKFFIAQASVCPTKEITVKFCTNDDSIWLYGITLFIVSSVQPTCNSIIDYASVDQMLRSSNIHLSEKAERAKTFIMNYSTLGNNANNDTRNLHGLLQKWNSLGGNSKTLLSQLSEISTVTNNGNESVLTSENGNTKQDKVNDLKNYVDKKIQQLEERVQNNLQICLKEFEHKQNEKLDNIIQLLQKR